MKVEVMMGSRPEKNSSKSKGATPQKIKTKSQKEPTSWKKEGGGSENFSE